jgi:hypothetical protein
MRHGERFRHGFLAPLNFNSFARVTRANRGGTVLLFVIEFYTYLQTSRERMERTPQNHAGYYSPCSKFTVANGRRSALILEP